MAETTTRPVRSEEHSVPSEKETNDFYKVLAGHIFFQSLSAAVQFSLFDLLQKIGPSTEEEIAKNLGIEQQPCRILLLPLTVNGLLVLDDGKYTNSRVSAAYLCSSQPRNILNVVKWQHFINYKAMFHLYDSIVANKNLGLKEFSGNEPTLYQRLSHDKNLEAIFQLAMQDISRQAQVDLVENVDFSNIKYLVDVGGGNASNIITIAKKYPSLRATVFDSESVCKIARENIQKNGLGDRLTAVAGDCFSNSFPINTDCLLFCHFFTIWSKNKDLELLTKAYKELKPGGRAMIFNMMQNNSKDGPLLAAMGSPYFLTLATGTGMLYTWQEYIELFEKAGFTEIKFQKLPMDHGVIWGIKSED